MKLLIALGTFIGALVFAGILTAIASSAFVSANGRPQNQILIPVFIITFIIGWLFLFALARRRGK